MDALDPFRPLADLTPAHWRPYGPMHSPGWRWFRARWLFETKGRASPRYDDDEVRRARDYLRRRACGNVTPGRRKPGRPDPVIEAALALVADHDPHRRSVLEAYLLTEEPFDAIARRVDLAPEVVATYHAHFFAVRDYPAARDWLLLKAVGCGPWNEFAGPQPEGIWKYSGFSGGARLLELVIAVTTNQPFPAWVREAGGKDDVEIEKRLRLNLKTVIALMTSRSSAEPEKLLKVRNQLERLNTQRSDRGTHGSAKTKLMEAFLTLPGRRRKSGELFRTLMGEVPGSVRPSVTKPQRKSCPTSTTRESSTRGGNHVTD